MSDIHTSQEGTPTPLVTPLTSDQERVRMQEMINSLGPGHETERARRLYQGVLDTRGTEGVRETMRRVLNRLGEDGGELAEHRLLRHERDLVGSPYWQACNRRLFLHSTIWVAAAAFCLGGGAADAADQMHQALSRGGDHEHPAGNYAHDAAEFYQSHLLPYEELLFGIALVNEGWDKWQKLRLRQIEQAVLKLAEKLNLKTEPVEEIKSRYYVNKPALKRLLDECLKTEPGHWRDNWMARSFLNTLLERHGAEKLLMFIQRANKSIDDKSELTLEADFDPDTHHVERRIFDSLLPTPSHLNSSDWLETWGWLVPGAACAAAGLAKIRHRHVQGNGEEPSTLIDTVGEYSDASNLMLGFSLVNEFNLNWERIKRQQIAEVAIDLNDREIVWREMTPQKLHDVIDNLEDPEEKFAGMYFFNALLRSPAGLVKIKDFLERARNVLDESSADDLPKHFTDEEKGIFAHLKCRPNLNFENYLHTAGWGIPGIICIINGALSLSCLSNGWVEPDKHGMLHRVAHMMHEKLKSAEAIHISLALINEARETWRKHTFGEVGEGTLQLSEMISKEPAMARS